MSDYRSYALPVGRVLIALIFVLSGFGKFADPASAQGYMAAFGLPSILLWPAAAMELIAGILLIIGYQTRIAALLLAGFSLLSGLIFHTDFADQTQMIMFMKNLAIAGGLLFLVGHGAGRMSVDERA